MDDRLDPPHHAGAAMDSAELRLIAASVRADLSPEYVAVLRGLPPGMRVRQAFALWRMARDALVRQGLRQGLSAEQARQAAARRLLACHDDPAA